MMRVLISLLAFFSVFSLSIAYADNFHIKNRTKTDEVATVYFNGLKEGTYTINPGKEYVHDFWRNLAVKVVISNPKTQQSCSMEMNEVYYSPNDAQDIYEPKITQGKPNCRYYSSFDQDAWLTYGHRPEPQSFSTIYIWTPWL